MRNRATARVTSVGCRASRAALSPATASGLASSMELRSFRAMAGYRRYSSWGLGGQCFAYGRATPLLIVGVSGLIPTFQELRINWKGRKWCGRTAQAQIQYVLLWTW